MVSRWLLAAISSLSPFGVSIMVPLVPLLSVSMGHSVTDLQYLFSIYVIGLAVSQPIVGVIADEGEADDSYCCWDSQDSSPRASCSFFAETLQAMILLRFLQAVGVGVGTVVARGIIRINAPPAEALKAFALHATMGFTPVVAPVVGGFLAPRMGVSSVFALLAVLGAGLLILCFHSIPLDNKTEPASGNGA